MKLSILLAFILELAGCATTRLYPVCYYNLQPTREDYQEALPSLKQTLRTALGQGSQLPVAESPDGRWLVTKATDSQNLNAAKAWPRIGCIGKAENSPTVKQEADCVAYQVTFVRDNTYFAFGKFRDSGNFDIWNESPNDGAVVHCAAVKSGNELPQAVDDGS